MSSSVRLFFLCTILAAIALPQTITVAAAADLSAAEPALASQFEKTNPPLLVRFVTGASSVLAQQLQAGAPFDVFLSADISLIDKLKLDKPRPYAVGRLALLWRDGKAHPAADLAKPEVGFLAIANPKLAPYGLAAQHFLESSALWDKVKPKLVYGENVRQTLQQFDSGNADAVLTALSLVTDRHPQVVRSEIVQKGGIVPTSKNHLAAEKFMDWLVSPEAQVILARYGFDKP